MPPKVATKQYSFRLPTDLIANVEDCRRNLRRQGLELNRTDVVRLLLRHALRTTKSKPLALMKPRG